MKYIVYKTTNTVNNKIYIGVHKTVNPDEFDHYLGCGVKDNDKHTYIHKTTPFEAAVCKYGPDKFIRETLFIFDTLDEALDKERELVNKDFIKRKDTYNIALGGGIPPAVTKKVYQFSLDGKLLSEYESITEASIKYECSSSGIGSAVLDKTPSMGYLWAETDSINVEEFKIDENKVKCYLYDKEGNYIQEFISITECANFLGIKMETLSTHIKGRYCCKKLYYVALTKEGRLELPELSSHRGYKVYQYSLEGDFIKEWQNLTEVQKVFGKNVGISKAIRLGASCKGFQWSWDKVPNMSPLKTATQSRKVGKYTLGGELVAVFDTVREAKKDTSGAPNVLSGKRKTAGGHIFKYIE